VAEVLRSLKDERDVLEVLKSELEYLENGGYSKRGSWGPGFIFEVKKRGLMPVRRFIMKRIVLFLG
jgi:hypothetical protein